ncbi:MULTISPECIES: D-2-hydroxyacid dehydrogenase [unclassified Agrococcus]|uniref:D-2-hydroxyacid dehydrogenase n=1 Tax=unclassified Agrococcus TaxID=2615065 RepID=UPI003609585A
MGRLRVGIAAALPEALCERLEALEPRIEVVRDVEAVPPAASIGEWARPARPERSEAQRAAWRATLAGCDALFGVPGSPAELASVLAASGSVRWVHTMAAGGGSQVKAAGLDAETLERVTFTTSAGVHGAPLAEWAVLGVLAGAKDVPRLERQRRERSWDDGWAMRHVEDMTVLVVGLGGIGTQVAARLGALGATIWGTTRTGQAVPHVDRLVPADDLAEAASQVDAIVLTLPGTARTEGLVGDAVLAGVRPGTILVNVGRGTVVDEDALVRALDDGRIGYAALDVTAVEPLPQHSPLWSHERVLLSPHTAALHEEEPARIVALFADNARRLLDGEPMRNVVDTVEFY